MGVEAWVHCDQHGRPHRFNDDLRTCWCGCIQALPDVGPHGTILGALNREEAYEECRKKGLWLYDDLLEAEWAGWER